MRKASVVFVALVGLTACKRKLKLEGKVTGFKPGTDTLVLHVVSKKGASVSCEPPGYGCSRTDVGASGQADIELETQATQTEKRAASRGDAVTFGNRCLHVGKRLAGYRLGFEPVDEGIAPDAG